MRKYLFLPCSLLLSLLLTYTEASNLANSDVTSERFANPSGLFFAEFYRQEFADIRVGWYRVVIPWSEIETQEGVYDWNSRFIKNIERIIIHTEAIPLPVIRTGEFFRTKIIAHRKGVSSPPKDLESSFHPEYGYSKSYYNFVRAFVERFKDDLKIIVIENEVTAKNFWTGTMDEYVRLFKTARKAIKDVNPDILIADSGLASPVWGICIAREWLDNSSRSEEEIFKFYKGYTRRMKRYSRHPLRNMGDLKRELYLPQIDRIYKDALYLLRQLKDYIDVVNFHYYEPVEYLDEVVSWIRLHMGGEKLIMSNEYGIRSRGSAFETEDELAREIKQKIIKAKQLNFCVFIWFAYDGTNNNYGLFDRDRRPRRKLIEAFKESIKEVTE